MIFRKKFLLLTLFLIIIIQTLLYTNNNQKTSFRFFKSTVKEVTIGKIISISFFSGLFISTLLNTSVTTTKRNNFKNIEENYEPQNLEEDNRSNEEDNRSNIDIPPQRDIRDAQPTISVNYRVVKNTDENYLKREQNYSNNPDNKDDWDNDDNDW